MHTAAVARRHRSVFFRPTRTYHSVSTSTTRHSDSVGKKYSQDKSLFLSPQEMNKLFPTLATLSICGAAVNVCKFPLSTDEAVRDLDLTRLERLDKHIPSIELIHPNKVLSFHGGRVALRRALSQVTQLSHTSHCVPSLMRLPGGAPKLPPEYAGSISHKDNIAAACALLRPLTPT